MRLSEPMRIVLHNMATGIPAANHVHGMSASGGFVRTMYALRRRGLIDHDDQLTPEGKRVGLEIAARRKEKLL